MHDIGDMPQHDRLEHILASWERRAQVRQNTLAPASLFRADHLDFLPQWLPFHEHPTYRRQRHLDGKILSVAWLIYNQVTLDIEREVVIPLCLSLQPQMQGCEPINTLLIQALTDEAYHILITDHACAVTRSERDLADLKIPMSGFVGAMQAYKAACDEPWQKHLVGLATAVVTEVFIGAYLAQIGRCQDEALQPMNVLITKAHMLDESVHSQIFAELARQRMGMLSAEQQAFLRKVLPRAVAWYTRHRTSAWDDLLPLLGFQDSAKMLADCASEPPSIFREKPWPVLEALAGDLGCDGFADQVAEAIAISA